MTLLETRAVNVRFGGHHAVRDVDLSVDVGRITGLIGIILAVAGVALAILGGTGRRIGGRAHWY